MPRSEASPRPSCPMVQLIICSATRKLMLAYASLCLHNCRVSRPEPQWKGGLTDWLGIRGLGLDLKMSGPLRTWGGTLSAPPSQCFSQYPGLAVGSLTPLTVWTETLLTNTNTDITASQQGDKDSEGQHVGLCESCMCMCVIAESKECMRMSICPCCKPWQSYTCIHFIFSIKWMASISNQYSLSVFAFCNCFSIYAHFYFVVTGDSNWACTRNS